MNKILIFLCILFIIYLIYDIYFIENFEKGETIDIITNEHNYEQALDVRKDNKKCGEDAIFFKKNYFKFITIPYYFFVENRVLSLLCSSVLIPYIGLILFIIK
jgi:hypothetical protein